MKLSIEVGSRIRELRNEHGDTQVALSEKIGVRQCTVCQWEYGYYLPTIAHILALCKLYNTTPNYILMGAVNGDRNTVRDLMRTRKPVAEPEVSDEELMSIMFGGGTKYDD